MEDKEMVGVMKERLARCIDWLQEQNENPDKIKPENDIDFIVESNQLRTKFLAKVVDESIPQAIDEDDVKPTCVPIMHLRTKHLSIECEWPSCKLVLSDCDKFQDHVANHINDLQIINNTTIVYGCLWDTCNHKSPDYYEMVRHMNYHSYHAKLLAIGLNGRLTLNLSQCKKESKNRNRLPELKSDHTCMWVGCEETFNCMQMFLKHARHHLDPSSLLCSWAGCGLRHGRMSLLVSHLRSHTGERQIACYHCGMHFATNKKLKEHVDRQTQCPRLSCSVCGYQAGSPSLLVSHSRAHVATLACTFCDMSLPNKHSLAAHVRVRHLTDNRHHPCPQCPYRSKTKSDLKRHIEMHKRHQLKKDKLEGKKDSDSDSDSMSFLKPKPPKVSRKYSCHMCSEKVFSRGDKLTSHLVRVHGVQWPCGHSRFRYQISEDGMYRLTTTRYESLEVSQKIMERKVTEELPDSNNYVIKIDTVNEALETRPKQIIVTVQDKQLVKREKDFEITMCDVDEHGNIIHSKVLDDEDVVFIKGETGADVDM